MLYTVTPPPYKDVMVTFVGEIYVRDKYYGHFETAQITKRGFFHNSSGYYDAQNKWVDTPNGYFSIPPRYEEFKGVMLPAGWGGHRVDPYSDNLISWNFI